MKSRFLLYKNDFKFQLGFKVIVKKGEQSVAAAAGWRLPTGVYTYKFSPRSERRCDRTPNMQAFYGGAFD